MDTFSEVEARETHAREARPVIPWADGAVVAPGVALLDVLEGLVVEAEVGAVGHVAAGLLGAERVPGKKRKHVNDCN